MQESVSRIQAALGNSGYRWPGPKVTINLAPADVKKDSAALDLPIAVAVLLASGQFPTEKIDEYLILGELALDGRVRPVRGALAAAMFAAKTRGATGGRATRRPACFTGRPCTQAYVCAHDAAAHRL